MSTQIVEANDRTEYTTDAMFTEVTEVYYV